MSKKHEIEAAAMALAKSKGLLCISRDMVCDAVKLPPGSFWKTYGGTFDDLICALYDKGAPLKRSAAYNPMRPSNKQRHLSVLLQGARIAMRAGIEAVNFSQIARAESVSRQAIHRYYTSVDALRKAVVEFMSAPANAQELTEG